MKTRCCVVGGGPAGMMLGYLLGRAGVDVVVLEKHADFFRDFRGDTVHPSTLQVMDELGLIDSFLKLPHQRLQQMDGLFAGTPIRVADLSRLHTKYPFIAFMPQWDFLNFLREAGKRFASLKVMMNTEAVDLIRRGEAIAGVRARTPDGSVDIEADLTIACDGRHSIVRERAGLLCIGDAAHAMSPVGGVGVNLAVQDAVATANLLADKLQRGCPSEDELDAVRRRREFPVKMTQAMQVVVQNNIISGALQGG